MKMVREEARSRESAVCEKAVAGGRGEGRSGAVGMGASSEAGGKVGCGVGVVVVGVRAWRKLGGNGTCLPEKANQTMTD